MIDRRQFTLGAGAAVLAPWIAWTQTYRDQWVTMPSGKDVVLSMHMTETPETRGVIFGGLLAWDSAQLEALLDDGFLVVSTPSHCKPRPDGPNGIACWFDRMALRQDALDGYAADNSAALDWILANGMASPHRIGAMGGSWGGFMQLHFAIRDPRVRAVAALAPVIDPRALREGQSLDQDGLAKHDLANHARALKNRSVWLSVTANDARVDTNATLRLANAIRAQRPDPDLRLLVTEGEGHDMPADSIDAALAWMRRKLAPPKA